MFGLFKKKLAETIKSISSRIKNEGETREETEIVKEDETVKEDDKEDREEKVEAKTEAEDKEDKAKTEEDKDKTDKDKMEGKAKTEDKGGILSRVARTFTHVVISEDALDDILWELELALLENNVAMEVSQKICADIKSEFAGKSVQRGSVEKIITESFKKSVRDIVDQGSGSSDFLEMIAGCKKAGKPAKILVVGFNGSGKTTTLSKIAKYVMDNGFSCVFAAGDTFRAAAIQQLQEHAVNLSVKLIKHDYGADSSAVIFDALKYAESKNIDVVLADTAGRNHQDSNLLDELKKITRVINPDVCLLVVESIAGNDVVEQAKKFSEVKLDGFVLTKWDVDNKGGAALTLTYMVRKPIYFLGTGQGYDDLELFDSEAVVNNII